MTLFMTITFQSTSRVLARLVAAGLLLVVSSAHAEETYLWGNFTGEEMLKFCRIANNDSVRDFERGICTGFIDAFAAGHYAAELLHAFHHRDEKIDDIYGHLCVPKSANRVTLEAIFVRYLESHADKLKWNAGLLLENALREAYPCKTKN